MSTGVEPPFGGVTVMRAPSTSAASVLVRGSTATSHVPLGAGGSGSSSVGEALPMLTGRSPTGTSSSPAPSSATGAVPPAGGVVAVGL
ncbi:hypothetical protein ACFCX7_04965 [Streptomyces microflavus]|uniref:hypothetical protein n=1 Tax=Streptomyces microflavus TaxID=1919 RepID=UPI0035E070CA